MNILAIETSCDETACAVVEDGTKILSSVVASSTDLYKKYGGIVPEIAAREQLKCIIPVITEALSMYSSSLSKRSLEVNSTKNSIIHSRPSSSNNIHSIISNKIDAIAVTVGPGLIGSLLVGVETAKTIAFVTGKPIIPVNHVLAHMYANFVSPSEQNSSRGTIVTRDNLINFPAISLVVSGGHTELYLMKSVKELVWLGGTLDDAAGECFDKTARLLGFGNGGGQAIEKAANKYQASPRVDSGQASVKRQVKLPRPMMKEESFNFSFSGLKTAVMREWKKYYPNIQPTTYNPQLQTAFAYEIQESITDVLVEKTMRAAKLYGASSILLSGGVASNLRLREKFNQLLTTDNAHLFVPLPALCTDNAVMIAACAFFTGIQTGWHLITATPDLTIQGKF